MITLRYLIFKVLKILIAKTVNKRQYSYDTFKIMQAVFRSSPSELTQIVIVKLTYM